MSLQQIMYAHFTNVCRTININKLLYTCIHIYKFKKQEILYSVIVANSLSKNGMCK